MKKEPVFIDSFKVTIVRAMSKCGKASCRCNKGLMHGPYWYARLRSTEGLRRTVYIGKTLMGQLERLQKVRRLPKYEKEGASLPEEE